MGLNFGIIGTGSIADGAHAPALNALPNAVFHSVLGRSSDKTAAFAQKHGATRHFIDLSAFLEDKELDAVIIASPDNLHAVQILACARAGKHVLVEKPMAVSLEECALVEEACRANGVKLALGYHLRWHAGHQLLHDKICAESALGDLRHMRINYTFAQTDASNWRAQTELGTWWSLAATGAHCVDLAFWFAGKNRRVADRASLISRKIWRGPHDESAMVNLLFDDGLTVEIFTSVLFPSPSRFELYGTDGFAICEDTLNRKGAGQISLSGTPVAYTAQNPYEAQLADFISIIESNGTSTVNEDAGTAVVRELLLAAS